MSKNDLSNVNVGTSDKLKFKKEDTPHGQKVALIKAAIAKYNKDIDEYNENKIYDTDDDDDDAAATGGSKKRRRRRRTKQRKPSLKKSKRKKTKRKKTKRKKTKRRRN